MEQAKELGLENPAMNLLQNNIPVIINEYVNPNKKGLQTENDVEKGIMHIIASFIATHIDVLTYLRKMCERDQFAKQLYFNYFIFFRKTDVNFMMESKKSAKVAKKDDSKNVDESKFADYFNFKTSVRFIKPHQVKCEVRQLVFFYKRDLAFFNNILWMALTNKSNVFFVVSPFVIRQRL